MQRRKLSRGAALPLPGPASAERRTRRARPRHTGARPPRGSASDGLPTTTGQTAGRRAAWARRGEAGGEAAESGREHASQAAQLARAGPPEAPRATGRESGGTGSGCAQPAHRSWEQLRAAEAGAEMYAHDHPLHAHTARQ
eukprot:scaffold5356_cov118-Isochrysis_galbana.AAC.6